MLIPCVFTHRTTEDEAPPLGLLNHDIESLFQRGLEPPTSHTTAAMKGFIRNHLNTSKTTFYYRWSAVCAGSLSGGLPAKELSRFDRVYCCIHELRKYRKITI